VSISEEQINTAQHCRTVPSQRSQETNSGSCHDDQWRHIHVTRCADLAALWWTVGALTLGRFWSQPTQTTLCDSGCFILSHVFTIFTTECTFFKLQFYAEKCTVRRRLRTVINKLSIVDKRSLNDSQTKTGYNMKSMASMHLLTDVLVSKLVSPFINHLVNECSQKHLWWVDPHKQKCLQFRNELSTINIICTQVFLQTVRWATGWVTSPIFSSRLNVPPKGHFSLLP